MDFLPAAHTWSPHLILIDADYADSVAFDLTVNFERMIGRRIPPADLPKWLDCLALDGGLRPGDNSVQAVFVHRADSTKLRNFRPADFAADLDGKAFRDNLGEFTLHSVAMEGPHSPADFFAEAFETLLTSTQIRRLMVVADMDLHFDRLRRLAERAPEVEGREVTLFAMAPLPGSRAFRSEILGYSLMAALGIGSDEIQAG